MAKGPGSLMSAPAIRSKIDRKLHRFARPAYSGVSAPAERSRDVEAEGQRLADIEARGLRLESQRGEVRIPD